MSKDYYKRAKKVIKLLDEIRREAEIKNKAGRGGTNPTPIRVIV